MHTPGFGQASMSVQGYPVPHELSYIERKMMKNEKLSAVWLQISKYALE